MSKKLTHAQLKALDQLLFSYPYLRKKIEIRKRELDDIPRDEVNLGGSRGNHISKPVESAVERWSADVRLQNLYLQKEAIEKTLAEIDDELTEVFWLRWSIGSVNTWEMISEKMFVSSKTIYRMRERILEILADHLGY